MKSFTFLALIIGLISCGEDKHQKDVVENRYYSDYIKIYNSYDSLGTEQTVTALNEYLKEFPNAQNAYIYKAWVLGKANKLSEIDAIFTKAISYDSTNAKLYQYWVSIILKDSNQLAKAKNINQIAAKLDNTNLFVENNNTWIEIFEGNHKKAYLNALEVLEKDTVNTNNFYSSAAIASHLVSKDSLFVFYKEKAEKFGFQNGKFLEDYQNGSLTINELYNKL